MGQAAPVDRSWDLEDIDLSDPEFWCLPPDEREGAFATLREQKPVAFFEEIGFPGLPKGPGYWALTRYEDVRRVNRDSATFISGQGSNIPDMPLLFRNFFGSMINMDDPRHGRLRRIVSAGFTPRRVAALNAYVDEKARQVVDRLRTLGGECDFVQEVSAPLPLEIICEMMGIGQHHWGRVLDLTNVILSGGDPEFAASMDQILLAANEMAEIGRETANAARANPRDDLVSALVNANVDGEFLSPDDYASFFILLAAAGNETTRTAISHGMKALTDYPDQRELLMSDLDAHLPGAVEEIVRWATPVIHFRRTCTQDVVIGDQPIKAGEKVVMFYNSANRDERAFKDPYVFDIRRDPNEHVGYGGGGAHFCLGANLARREISALFRELLTRVPTLRTTGEPDILQSGFIHGIKRMTCSF